MPSAKGASSNNSYELSFDSSAWAKRVVSAQFTLELDRESEAVVTFARPPEPTSSTAFKDLPKEVKFEWQGKHLFKATFLSSEILGPTLVRVRFADRFYLARKTYDNSFFKDTPLSDALSHIASKMDLSAKFSGDFSEQLPIFDLSGPTLLEHLQGLSYKCGYFTALRPHSDTAHFIRLSESVKSASADFQKVGLESSFSESVTMLYQKGALRTFDPERLEAKNSEISSRDLYQSSGQLGDGQSFRDRQGQKLAAGVASRQMSDYETFAAAERHLSNQVSKEGLVQAGCTVKLLTKEPVGLPGDRLTISNLPQAAGSDLSLLVSKTVIKVEGAIPTMQLEGVRL